MKKLAVLLGAVFMSMAAFAAETTPAAINNDLIPKVSGELRTRVEGGTSTVITKDKNGNETKKVSNNYVNSAVADRARLVLTWTKTFGIIDAGFGVRMNIAGATNFMETMQLDKTYIKVNLPVVSYVYQANKDELELGGLNYIFSPNNAKDNLSLEYDAKNAIEPIFIDAKSTTGAIIAGKIEGFRLESKINEALLIKVSAIVDVPDKGNYTTSVSGVPDLKVSTSNIGTKLNGIFTINKDSYIDAAVVAAVAGQKYDFVTNSAIVTNTYDNSYLGLGVMGKNKLALSDSTALAIEYEGTLANATRKSTVFSSNTASISKDETTSDIGFYAKATYAAGLINPYLQATARKTDRKDNPSGNTTRTVTNLALTPGLAIIIDKMTFETEVNIGSIVDDTIGGIKTETGSFYIRERLKYKF